MASRSAWTAGRTVMSDAVTCYSMPEIPMNAVQITGVTKTFGDLVAVNDLSLSVPEGSVFGFIGPNGSGKTTTIRMIVNIFYPDRGEIRVFGRPLDGPGGALPGYLPEERGLYRKMKVRPLLEFFGELRAGARCGRKSTSGWRGWIWRTARSGGWTR